MRDPKPLIFRSKSEFPAIQRNGVSTLQLNLGYRCNMSCSHCHVNAGPNRTEVMSSEVVGLSMDLLERGEIQTLDLTGGAPEMHPQFRELVQFASQRGVEVIDRCNLTILLEPGFEYLADFLAEQKVRVVASLPCYLEENVDQQRGKGTFTASVRALQLLNDLGFGQQGSGLELDLVYNPNGFFLPPPQEALQLAYKEKLREQFGVEFNRLLTITNMPIARFGSTLMAKGEFDNYMALLKGNYAESNLEGLMCKSTISVDWQGYLFDCDFNQMLNLPMMGCVNSSNAQAETEQTLTASRERLHLRDLDQMELKGAPIEVADHCYGCTAGQGSSCGGALNA